MLNRKVCEKTLQSPHNEIERNAKLLLERLQPIFDNKIQVHKLGMSCKQGSLLYYPGLDILSALHQALHNERKAGMSENSRLEDMEFWKIWNL